MYRRLIGIFLLLLLCGCAAPSPATETATLPATEAATQTPVSDTATPSDDVPDMPAVQADAVQILFVNVGKADMALILAGGKAYAVDTGEKTSVAQAAAALKWAGVDTLSGVFLTHTHSDHIGGMKVLPAFVAVDTVYRASLSEDKKKGGNKIDDAAEDASAALVLLDAGDTVPLSDGVAVTVLGPLVLNTDDDNDNSLVLLLEAFGSRVLLTGDMQFAEEESLLAAGVPLAADVLKIGNHGNPDATGDAFAQAVSPSAAVVSTDTDVDTDSDNPRVRAALSGAAVYSTEGTSLGVLVTLTADGGITVGFPEKQAPSLSLTLTDADREEQRVTVKNMGGDADISGCFLVSERGTEVFVFPDGTTLPAGASVTVGCDAGCDLRFPDEESIFHKKKDDAALLYDAYGNLLARMPVQ